VRAGLPWRAARAGVAALAGLVLVYLVLPTLVIVPLSFSSESFMSFPPPGFSPRWYQAFAASVDYRLAIWNSVRIGVPAALLATALGTLAALGLVRGELRGRRLLSALMLAPLILPQIILAIGLFPVMVRLGIIGTYPAILFGHAVVSMPLAFVTVAASLRAYPPTYELAAMTLGASRWATFRHVTFPMIRPGMLVGFIFAFAFSFDELILAIFLTSPATRTVPRLLWEQLNYQMTPVIAAATCVLLAVTATLLLAAARLGGRRVADVAAP
jgi:ABC-type spermidine/putrescine transport system permease subunit II